jgi:signal peptidase II
MNILSFWKLKKDNFFKKKNIYILLIISIIFFFDRISKLKVINKFSENTFYINKFVNFDLIWNNGIGFGILSTDSNLLYMLISVIIGAVIITLLFISFTSEKIDKFIFALIIGGALGNFYDRLVYKAVPDFIDIHYDNFHWFTFNVADIFISIGVFIFILRSYFIKS